MYSTQYKSRSNLQNLIKFNILILFLFAATACTTNPNKRPDWIDSPSGGGLSAVGSASYDIFGESWARERATKLALAELALQKGSSVEVSGEVNNKQTVSGNNFSEHASISTKAIIKGQEITISAKIERYWKDWQGKKVWVLLIEE